MKTALLVAAAATTLVTACATKDAGVRDPQRFREIAERSAFASDRPHTEVAQCFRENAALLPMTDFIDMSPTRTIYRLRGYGYTFEEIDFVATPQGSEITTLLAPGLNARWRQDFARDRLAPLRACAAPA